MGKMHELLAVENAVKEAADNIIKETINTFTKKAAHFHAQHKSYEPRFEDGETFESEDKPMVTTVPKKLEHTKNMVSKYIDVVAQKELTNTEASAVLEVDGVPLFEKPLPATLLLALEGKLRQLREVYNAAPTLDPARSWNFDESTKTYEATPSVKYKTKKVMKNHVKAPATDRHPAQVDVYTEDERIGSWHYREWSGAISAAQKSVLLEQLDKLQQAVKKARQRANDCEVKEIKIGERIFDFINRPLKV